MSSSPAASTVANTTRLESLISALGGMSDPRSRRGRRFELAPMLAAAVVATLGGARSFAALAQSVASLSPAERAMLGLGDTSPEESTWRKLFARLDTDLLDAIVGSWMFARTTIRARRRVIAIDGKTVRGARTDDDRAPHLVAGLDHHFGVVLGQVCADMKSNEIPAARTLLASIDLSGTVVTADAMHTQTATAQAILDGHADYLLTVKGNMPTLHAYLKDIDWKSVPATSSVQTGHGRRVRRTIKVVDAPKWIEFPGAAQVAQIRRTATDRKTAKRTCEVVYIITSAPFTDAKPETLAEWTCGHWSIENKLHWVRDVSFGEDASKVRTGQAPRVMASLRNTAISLLRLADVTNIAAALRHHHKHADQAMKLVLT